MKLKLINEKRRFSAALRNIYRYGPRHLRPQLHKPTTDAIASLDTRALGARSSDPGTPHKLRHRKFFRMSNDGGTELRY